MDFESRPVYIIHLFYVEWRIYVATIISDNGLSPALIQTNIWANFVLIPISPSG